VTVETQVAGKVKWYNPDKAYGFITTDDGRDLFVHRTSIADGRSWLAEGQGVSCIVRDGAKGPQASEVRVLSEASGSEGPGAYTNGHDAPRRSAWGVGEPLPHTPVEAEVLRLEPSGRFMFVRAHRVGDVYVHGSLLGRLGYQLRPGDRVRVLVQRGERGLRAASVEPA
jgi:CspA family cold shock protein